MASSALGGDVPQETPKTEASLRISTVGYKATKVTFLASIMENSGCYLNHRASLCGQH